MEFKSPVWFVVFLILWIVGGNLIAWNMGWHVSGPFGYCQGYGC